MTRSKLLQMKMIL